MNSPLGPGDAPENGQIRFSVFHPRGKLAAQNEFLDFGKIAVVVVIVVMMMVVVMVVVVMMMLVRVAV